MGEFNCKSLFYHLGQIVNILSDDKGKNKKPYPNGKMPTGQTVHPVPTPNPHTQPYPGQTAPPMPVQPMPTPVPTPVPAPAHHGGYGHAQGIGGRDYVVLIDQSGSMAIPDIQDPNTGQFRSRWQVAAEGVTALAAKVLQLDPDGIEVCLFSQFHVNYHIQNAGQVQGIFVENDPLTNTNLSTPLAEHLERYFQLRDQGRAKPTTILVITDGQPNNQDAVTKILVNASNRCRNGEELGVSFIQVGNDPFASAFLRYLDDGLRQKGARNDIVDTKHWSFVERHGFNKVLTDAIID